MAASHQQADLFLRRARRIDLASDASAVQDEKAIGQRSDLLELGGHQQDGATGVAQRHDLPMNELDGTDVDASRRLRNQQQFGAEIKFAPNDQFLLIST